MSLTEFAVKRPVAMSMLILMFVVMGLYSYRMIGVDLYPAMNMPYVTVSVGYDGAGAEEIETQIIKPLESTLSSLSMLKNMNSQATEGSGSIVLEFEMSANADQVAIDVQKKVDAAKGQLPDNASEPQVNKIDVNAISVMSLAVKSQRPMYEIYDLANDIIKEKLQTISGVTDVTINGGQIREIHVNIDKSRLENYGLSINTVTNRLAEANLNQPSGSIERPESEYNVRVIGEFRSIEEIENLPIPVGNGSVPLKAIAAVWDTYQKMKEYSRVNGMPALSLDIYKQSDASVVKVGDAINAALPAIQKELPSDVQIITTSDYSQYIHASVNGTMAGIIEGIITTALALFIFLRNWRSMLTVAVAIPTSLISTLIGMYFFHFTFNMMSLMGMALCIGILVDDSIVVLENIHRHRKMGKSAWQATIEGRSEIAMAAISITLSDVVVYAPIAFLSGIVGEFFRQFGLTVVFATLFSLFVSFTLTPMLAAHLEFEEETEVRKLKAIKKAHSPWGRLKSRWQPYAKRFWSILDYIGNRVATHYDKILQWSLDHRKTVLLASLAIFLATCSLVYPFGLVGAEFMEKMDEGELTVSLEMPIGTPLGKTDEALSQVEAYIKTIPEVKYYRSHIGSGGGYMGSSSSYKGQINITLVPKKERQRTMWDVGDQIRSFTKSFNQGNLTVAERESSQKAIQMEIYGPEYSQLVPLADRVMQLVKAVPGTKDVDMDYHLGQPEVQILVNNERAAAFGLTVSDIAKTLRASINGEVATEYRAGDKDIDVIVDLSGYDQKDMETMKYLTIASSSGAQVPLSELAKIQKGSGPTEIKRVNRQRVITVSGNVDSNIAQSNLNQEISNRLKEINLPLGYSIKQGGAAQELKDIFVDLIMAFMLSIGMVYMVLAMLYESTVTPLIRMLSLPLGLIGAILALVLTGKTLNLFTMLGIIMMDGVVAKNGTLLIDYTHTMQKQGKSLREALQEAGKTRLSPIMMTTVVMIIGMLPTALALQEGSEMRSGMAVVLIGGLITSTFFTLVVVPVVYTIIDDFKNWRQARKLDRLKKAVAKIEERANKEIGI